MIKKFLGFLVDDNPKRHGLVSPGLHIPVLPPQIIYDKKIDNILVLAWRYSDPIINKHKKYVKEGGNFIIPLSQRGVR